MIIQTEPELILTEVFVVDFGDNYHKLATDPSSELEKEARRIRRRYKHIGQYMNALSVYNEYMEILVTKHGGSQLFGIKNKYELIEEFVPPKPRMRNTLSNKFIIKNRILLSNIKNTHPSDSINDFIDQITPDDRSIEFTYDKAKDKEAIKLMKEEMSDLSIKKIKEITNLDYLEEYFKTKNIMKQEKEKKINISLSDILSGKYINKIHDTTDEDSVLFYNGRFMTQETIDDLNVYEKMNSSGWNSLRLMKHKNVSKRVTQVIQDKERGSKKRNKKRKKNDDFIIKIATDNDYDTFSDFEEDMKNFTAANIMRD